MTDTPLKKRVPQRCTLKELEEAVSYFRIAPATIERVQRVLVDGEAVSVVARGDNLTRADKTRPVPQHGHAKRLEVGDHVEDLLHDDRRQAHRRLVQEQA